jgi:hypothetical protein
MRTPAGDQVAVCPDGSRWISANVVVAGSSFTPERRKSAIAASVQGVTEDEGISHLGVIEGFHSQVVAGAKEAPIASIPDGKHKITNQMLDAAFAPSVIGMQDEICIGRFRQIRSSLRVELRDQIRPAIHTGIGGDPHLPVQARRLMLALGFKGGSQRRVTQAHMAIHPRFLRVGTSERHEIRQALQQPLVERGLIQVDDANNTTHSQPPTRKIHLASRAKRITKNALPESQNQGHIFERTTSRTSGRRRSTLG